MILLAATAAQAQSFTGENLEYEFGWKGISVANSTVKIKDASCGGPCYNATIEITGKPYLDMIWKVRDRLVMTASATDYSPRRYVFYQREGGFQLDTQIVYDKGSGLLKSRRFRVDKEKELTPKTAKTAGIFCPLSAILYLRAQPLDVGGTYQANVFDGKREHVVEWAVQGTEDVTVPAGTFRSKRINGKVVKSNVRDDNSNIEKVKAVTIWVTDDPNHVVLKIETEAFWGHIYGVLTKKD